MIKEILNKYKNRLINISKNKSFCSYKIIKNQAFDLFHCDNKDEILNFIYTRKKSKIKLKLKEEILIKDINTLQRNIINEYKETGSYNLFIGHPFVEGKLQDKSRVRCPLILFPVKIIFNNQDIFLENILESNILVNKVFIKGYFLCNNFKNKTEYETEINSIKDFNVFNFYKELNINIKNNKQTEIVEFSRTTKEEILNTELELKHYFILGRFPTSNSIYDDYEELESKEIENNISFNNLLNSNTKNEEKNNKNEFESVNLINKLDFTQEQAVLDGSNKNNLVIYGAPGTGKSQVISNIVADNLFKGKKVLVVAEKKTALDVVYNRLGLELQNQVVLISDNEKEKISFYNKLNNSKLAIEKYLNNFKYTDNEELIFNNKECKILDKKLNDSFILLEDIKGVFTQKQKNGLSLQEMYAKTEALKESDQQNIKLFNIYKHSNILNAFKDYNYVDINNIINDAKRFKVKFNRLQELKNKYPILPQYNFNNYNKALYSFILEKHKNLAIDIKRFSQFDVADYNWLKDIAIFNYNTPKQAMEELGKLVEAQFPTIKQVLNNKFGKNVFKKIWNYKKEKIKLKEENLELKECLTKNILFPRIEMTRFIQEVNKNIFGYDYYCLNEININKLLGDLSIINQYHDEYLELQQEIYLCNVDSIKILGYLISFYKEDVDLILKNFITYYLIDWIDILETENKKIRVLYKNHKNILQDIEMLQTEKRKITKKAIMHNWVKSNENIFNYKEFAYQFQKKRKLYSVRKLLKMFYGTILNILPCFLLTPKVVSNILPLIEGLFDVVIFDEASQMFIENSIPTIYRGKKIIIAGDDKQLKPTRIAQKEEDMDETDDNSENSFVIEQESLLDIAKMNYNSCYLNYHYRSKYAELINFSNKNFYNNRLLVSPNIEKYNALEYIKVDGRWVDTQNEVEADKVVEIVKNILQTRHNNESIGVVSFNSKQANLINDKLDEEANKDEGFKEIYLKELDRKEDGEDRSLFVKNIEKIQGDERDIIIFSIGYAKNKQGKLVHNFGIFSREGGDNRLNVAVSRAKQKTIIITSIFPEDLKTANLKHEGARKLKEYLEYVYSYSSGEEIYKNVSKNNLKLKIKDKLFEYLDENIYNIEYNLNNFVDIAIYNKLENKYILGIELDINAYKTFNTKESDIYKPKFLTSKGWDIKRIWVRDLYLNFDKEIKEIVNIIRQKGE